MNMIIAQNIQNGPYTLVGGEVTSIRKNADQGVVNVKLSGNQYNKETKKEEPMTLDIAFWNNDKTNKMLADQVESRKVKEGSFITVLCILKEESENDKKYGRQATAIRFEYSGLWRFPEKAALDEDEMPIMDEKTGEEKVYPERNYLVGIVSSLKEDATGKNRFVQISIPVFKSKEETEWHHVTLWNNEQRNLADNAKSVLAPREDGSKARAIIVCGKQTMFNDEPSYTGFSFQRIPDKK